MKNNVLANREDVLIIDVNPKITGNATLRGFTDSLKGITEKRYVTREFRVSGNGIFWTDWQELTNENLSKESTDSELTLRLQVRYTRKGYDESGEIEFQSLVFTGDRIETPFIAPTITESIFDGLIGSETLRKYEENIFKKLYFRGIVPKYITRGDNLNEKEDMDYSDFWFSVARFFAMTISFFKRFENFREDEELLREKLRQSNLYFNESDITLEELQYLAQNLYSEISKRGTPLVFKRRGELLNSGEPYPVDGEFVRLTRSRIEDELIYENIQASKFGWCMRNSSPLYKGTSQSKYLNKTAEDSQDFQSLSKYEINKKGDSSYKISPNFERKRTLTLKAKNGLVGLGRIDGSQNYEDKLVVLDSRMDYEITFAFKVTKSGDATTKLRFGVEGFNRLKGKLDDSFILPNGDSVSEIFFERELSKFRKDCWYYARGILHSYSSKNFEESLTNLGFGNNLYFHNPFVKFALPKIQLVSESGEGEVNIWDYKIRPLVRGTNILPLKDGESNAHSLGFIQSNKIFHIYIRNNNNSQSKEEITDIIERYLLPYDMTNFLTFLSNY